MVTYSCFRMATFRPATRKYATFYALRFRLLFVRSLPGGANGRHAKTRQNHGWVFAWRPFTFSPRKHAYTTWHKSATIKIESMLKSQRSFVIPIYICLIHVSYNGYISSMCSVHGSFTIVNHD